MNYIRPILLIASLIWPQGVTIRNISGPTKIVVDGTMNAATTSGTFTGTATGDLKVIAVTRNAAGCPTLAAGWTQIGSCLNAPSAGALSIMLACNVSSSSLDTGTGTWVNANRMMGVSYSNTAAGTILNCNTTGIGITATDGANTSGTVNFPTLVPSVTNGSSWILGFSADKTQAITCPTAFLNQRVASGTGVRTCDSNTGLTEWRGATTSATASIWITFMLEILSK
jgi:hypothetical protein